MRVAVVHDWLYIIGGAERVLCEILKIYPAADVFCLFDFMAPNDREKLNIINIKTSFLQKMPFMRTRHQSYLPLMPIAIEQFDLSSYDLVISSSYAVAKGVLTGPDQVHIAYVHSPMRYAWDMQHTYLRESGYDSGLKSAVARLILHRMRLWDVRTAHGPDAIVANSQFVARRISKVYGRKPEVIYPPVFTGGAVADEPRGDHFLAASRLVPYKNVRAIIEAFRLLPDLRLTVAGTGTEAARLRQIAGPNVHFTGFVSDRELRRLMATARAFVFAAEEDFGIVPVEAQSEGTPVLALGRGGALETVATASPGQTGMLFSNPDPAEIAACIREFTARESSFSREACRMHARRFSSERFRAEFSGFVDKQMAGHRATAVVPMNAFPRLRMSS